MINLTKYKLKLIVGNRGIKNYQNMSKEELLNAIVKSKRITENLLKNGPEEIARMENLSLKELEQIERMVNLSLNKLKQIAKARRIKTRKDASKGDLSTLFWLGYFDTPILVGGGQNCPPPLNPQKWSNGNEMWSVGRTTFQLYFLTKKVCVTLIFC